MVLIYRFNIKVLKAFLLVYVMVCLMPSVETWAQDRPNIVWIMAEDINNHLGSFGEKIVHTPNIDWLADNGVRYENAFTVSGVCAPSRASIVTGMYSTSIGTQHMRQAKSLTPYDGVPFYNAVPPPNVKAFTEYLRADGYFCTNSFKTDYQFGTPFTVWDSHSLTAGWWDREDKSKPFFSCFTFQTTHEINTWPDSTKRRFFKEFNVDLSRLEEDVKSRPVLDTQYIIDPAKVKLPPYYPNDITVRQDYARHLTNINRMDTQVGALINKLKADGLLDNTIIFFMGDNGDGLPRSKRWMNDGGIHVPLIIYAPLKWKKLIKGQLSGANLDMVSFVDLAPTVLSIANIPVPKIMQGQAFLGEQKSSKPRKYIFAGRDRMDAKYDLQRAVRSNKYKYIRNYWPDTAYNQYLDFMYQAPLMRRIDTMYRQNKLDEHQASWLAGHKPAEELYDITKDPYELTNLALEPSHSTVLKRMRSELVKWQKKFGDWLDTPEIIQAEKMWPGGVQPTTKTPSYTVSDKLLTLVPKTEGSSIGYRINGAKYWSLYHSPIEVKDHDQIEVKAVRYGFKESDVLSVNFQ